MEHKDIPDNHRHEPKGASGASAGQFIKSKGSGATEFSYISYNELLDKPNLSLQGYVVELHSASAASQVPVGVDIPLQVKFGSPDSTDNVSIDADGAVTFLTDGKYMNSISLSCGKGDVLDEGLLLFRTLLNGVQASSTYAHSVVGINVQSSTVTLLSPVDASEGDVLTVEIMQDSSMSPVGELITRVPSATGWSRVPSAAISVMRFSNT